MIKSLFLLASAFLVAAAPIPVEKRNPFQLSPLRDSFYDAPDNLDSLQNGEVYDSRLVFPNLELFLGFAKTEQIAYKTTGPDGNSSHTVATVFKPLIPAPGPKLFSYQFYEDAAELNCSPSYSLAKGVLAPDGATATADTAVAIYFALLHGYYVVAADHEGPNSAFIEGYTEGQAGLDGIRAAINHWNLPKDTATALYGYSGGGSATVWMSNLHESYAPEINIVGAAHGGTPVDLNSVISYLDEPYRLFSGFIAGALTGLLNAFPQLNNEIWPHFNQNLKNVVNRMRTPTVCILTEVLEWGHRRFRDDIDVDILTYKPFQDMASRESLLKNVSTGVLSVPKFPRYIFHAENDEIIPYAPLKQFVDEQCAGGGNIQFVPWKGNDHVTVEYLGLPDALQFVKQALDGNTPQVQCGTASKDILTVFSTTIGDAIGQGVANLIQGFNHLTTPLGTVHFN